MGCRELPDDSNNTWEINADLADYAYNHIKILVLNQTSVEDILRVNPIPFNIKRGFLLNPYLTEQGKRFQLHQDKSQQMVSFIYGPLSKIWTDFEAEKETLSNENKLILRRKIH